MSTRLEQLMERQRKLESEIAEEKAKQEAHKLLEQVNGKVASAIEQAVEKAGIDVKVLNGRFFQLTVSDEGKLTVSLAEKAKAKSNGNGSANGSNGNGNYHYLLKDGRGPFETIQDALDAMGVPANERPNHNRHERLSADLKAQIQKREKPAPETPESK